MRVSTLRPLWRLQRWRWTHLSIHGYQGLSAGWTAVSSTSTSIGSTTTTSTAARPTGGSCFQMVIRVIRPSTKKYGQWGQSSRDNWAALINAEFAVSDPVTLYGWANYRRQVGDELRQSGASRQSEHAGPDGDQRHAVSETAVLGVYPNGYQPYMTYAAKDFGRCRGAVQQRQPRRPGCRRVIRSERDQARTPTAPSTPVTAPSVRRTSISGSWKSRTTSATADYTKELPVAFLQSAVLSAGALYRHEFWGTGDLGGSHRLHQRSAGRQRSPRCTGPAASTISMRRNSPV